MSTFYLTPYSHRKEALFDNIFNDLWFSGLAGGQSHNRPKLKETEESVILKIDLPGFEKSEIGIDYHDEEVIIHAKSEDRSTIKHRYNVGHIDIKESSAELKNGVLELTLKKSESAKKQVLKIR